VLADADVETAATEAAHSRFRDAGQSCNAAKRMIVVPEVADAFIEAFMAQVQALVPGHPADAVTTLAPLTRPTCARRCMPRCWTRYTTARGCWPAV